MKRGFLSIPFLTLILLTFAFPGSASGVTVFVSENAPGPLHDGRSWVTAFPTVQEGINAAVAGDEVWVSQGTYVENILMKDAVAL
jgi:hypothetical protein